MYYVIPYGLVGGSDKGFVCVLGDLHINCDLLCLLGPVQKSKVVTMSTFLLHGTLHGGLGRLCQTPSQMSRMPSRASDSIQWNPRLPHKLHFNEIS